MRQQPRPITERLLEGPTSIRNAIRMIVGAMVMTTVLAAVLVWMFDRKGFPTFGDATWWAVQTVTTVGYGDVTPTNGIGRTVAAVVLIFSVAFISLLMAAITSGFVERARRKRKVDADHDSEGVSTKIDEMNARLERIETALASKHEHH